MRDVNIPNWLKGLPLAPEFHPTDTEFADPIAYISKIEKQAGAFGICKVIPPLPKPSKKYVLSNLNSSLSKSPELGLDVSLDRVEDNGAFRAVFTTRHQELGQSGKKTKGAVVHKQVWQSGEVYTLDQFESKSKAFARVQLGMVKEVSPLVVETMFWEAACEKPIYIEYANDVPGSGFGEPEGEYRHFRRRRRRGRVFVRGDSNSNSISNSNVKKEHEESLRNCNEGKCASPKYNGNSSEILPNVLADQTARVSKQKGLNGGNEMEGSSGWKLSNSPWNLQVIARSPGSLTRFMPDDIPGVTSPMVYIGMLFSWFAWHVEDHELHSLNFLHTGSSKTWYAVPGDYAFTFEEIIRTRAYGGNIDRLDALTLLGEKTTLLSPEEVVASGIPCCRLVQNPGEFVVTFPRAYHVGFSHGFNCGEAANFGTPKWLKVAKEAAVRRAAMNYLPMLSHQQLLYLLTMSFISRVPRSLLPGVRSSRLRDRQKEEREMLVKKAFIEDILNENNLLTILLQKSSSSHAVFWDLDSLPSSIKESELCNGTAATVATTLTEHTNSENGNNNRDLVSEMSLYMDNSYLDNNDDDLSYGFQVDSGTLPCVACGVLGFPFMSVVQPSEKASLHLLTANSVVSNFALEINGMSGDSGSADMMKPNENNLFRHPIGESSTPESKSCPALPDSFSTLKDLPVSKGWNTSIGYFRPRIFCLEHAIQIEELLQSKGGANVLLICHSDFQKIKAHAAAVAEEVGIPFKYNEIPLDDASNEDLNLINLAIDNEEQAECGEDWTSKLNINLRQCVKLRKKFPTEKVKHALTLDGLFFDPIPISSSLSLNWQSKKSRSKRNLNSSEDIIKPSEIVPIEKEKVLGAKSEGRKEDRIIQYQRRNFKSKPDENSRNMTETSPSENPGLLSSEKPVQSHVEDSVITANPVVENVKANTGNETSKEMIVEDKVCDSPREDSQMQYEIEKTERLCSEDSAVSVQVDESIEITAEICALDGTCDLVTVDDFGGDCNVRADEDVIMGDVSDPATPVAPCSDEQDLENFDERIEKKVMNGEVDDCVNMSDIRNESSDSKTVTSNVTLAINESTAARNGSKRKREVVPRTEVGFGSDGFIKSPCEGLRPRAMRGGADTKRTVHEKPATKKSRNSSDGIASREDTRKKRNVSKKPTMKKSNTSDERANRNGSNKCDLDGCRTSFKTKAELLLHKRNRCPHEGCRKKFSSHKYAVLHLRVHDDNRPLKCSWKGCTMSFKWAWARTEHLRVHTGERPYTCKVDGCGLTFRFVSDYSRHRRKTGHYVNSPN